MLIYEINQNEQNAFNSSTTQMKITNETNELAYETCNELLQKDLCHFDDNHKRAKSFVILSSGAYHQLLGKKVVFATMN